MDTQETTQQLHPLTASDVRRLQRQAMAITNAGGVLSHFLDQRESDEVLKSLVMAVRHANQNLRKDLKETLTAIDAGTYTPRAL